MRKAESTQRLVLERVVATGVQVAVALATVNFRGLDPSEAIALGLLPVCLAYWTLFDVPRPSRRAQVVVASFLVSAAVATAVGSPSLVQTGRFIAGVSMLFAIVTARAIGCSVRSLVVAAVGGAAASGLAGAVLSVYPSMTPGFLFYPLRDARFMGLAGDPNLFGLVCAALAPTAIFGANGRGRIILAVSGVLLVACCLMTISRSAWLALFVSTAIVYVGGRRLSMRPIAGLAIAVGAAMLSFRWLSDAGVPIGGVFGSRAGTFASSVYYQDDPAERDRATLYPTRRALAIAVAHPAGLGAGGLEAAVPLLWEQARIGAHNTLVEITGDFGWLAAASVVVVLLCLGEAVILLAVLRTPTSAALGAISIAAAIVVVGMFQDLANWSMAWMLVGLAVIGIVRELELPVAGER